MAAISRDFVTKNGIIIEGDSAVTSSTNQIDALQAAGGAAIAKNLIVGTSATIFGDATVNSSLTVNGQTNLGGPLIPLSSGVNLGSLATPFKDLYLSGNSLYVGQVVLSSTGTITTLSSTLGSVRLVVGSSRLTDTTNSTSTNTGALVVNGGIGVARDVYVGNNLNVINSSTLHGSANLLSTLTVQGQSTFADTTLATSAGAGSVKLAGGIRVSNNAVILSTASNTGTLESNSLYVAGGVGINSGLAVSGIAVFKNDVYFQGATTYVYSTNTIYTDNILDLHVPETGIDGTWIADDGKDIGFRFNYYSNGSDRNALLLLSNNSKKLEFFSDPNVYGEFKTGSIQIANVTSNNGSTNTGALTVIGGVGIGQNLRVGGIITATDIAFVGTVNAQGLVYQDSTGKLVSQPHIVYNTSTQVLVGTITRANNLTGGTIGSIPIQSNNGITTFIAPGSIGQVLIWDSLTNTPTWGSASGASTNLSNTATNLAAGAAGNVVYQSAFGRTAYLANGLTGSILTFNTGTLSPQWSEPGALSVGFASSSSYATSSTYAINAELATTATYALLANTSTRALLADTATYALFAGTATQALLANTATRALLADTATYALFAGTATRALLADTATRALLADTATHALLADTATYALLANTATYALLAETATYALLANTATYALLAETATYALLANTATYALLAETSTRALLADTATYALLAETSTYALLAGTATHALSADFATSATYAFTATYAEVGGNSASAQNLSSGTTGQVPYQFGPGITNFFGPGNVGDILVSAGTTSTGPVFTNIDSISVGTANNVAGGSTGSIVYQTGTDVTGMLSISSTAGSVLVSNGTIPQYVSQVQAIPNGVASYSTASGQSLVITEGGLGVVGDSYFSSNVNVANTLYIGGDLYVDGTQFIVNSQSIATGDKTLTLNTGASTAILAIDSGLQVGNVTTPYATFLFNGVDSWVTGGTNGAGLKVTSTASAYSVNSGALQVTGGVGIGGSLFVNGDVTATTFFGNLTGIATTATYALFAGTATRAISADFATSATYAFTATYAEIGGNSAFASTASWASTASNIAGGALGSVPYQSTSGITTFLGIGTSTYLLTSNGSVPIWASLSDLSSGNTAFADNIKDGTAGQLVYQISTSTTGFAGPGNVGEILVSNGTSGPLYTSTSSIYVGRAVLADTATLALNAITATYAVNILGGSTGSVVYQTGENTTGLLAGSSTNSILTYVNNAPSWSTTATLTGGVANSSTVDSQTLKITNGGVGVTGDSYFADRVGVGGSINVANTSYINNSRILVVDDLATDTTFSNTTDSFSTVTGALVVTGGVGIGKTLNVGSSATILSTLASTATVQNNALYVAGGVGIAKSLYVTGPAIFNDNVIFAGTATYVYSTNTVYTDNLINLHVPVGSTGTNHDWLVDDGQDIGLIFHYYKGSTDKNAFIGLANNTGYLEWYSNGTEVGAVFTGTSYGTFKTGSIILVDTTASTNTTTGVLQVAGGVGVGDSVYVKNRVGFVNASNVSRVYQVYNAATDSLDTVFG